MNHDIWYTVIMRVAFADGGISKKELEKWMLEVHIPEVLETKCFDYAEMREIKGHYGTDGYIINYHAPYWENTRVYIKDHQARLVGKFKEKFEFKMDFFTFQRFESAPLPLLPIEETEVGDWRTNQRVKGT